MYCRDRGSKRIFSPCNSIASLSAGYAVLYSRTRVKTAGGELSFYCSAEESNMHQNFWRPAIDQASMYVQLLITMIDWLPLISRPY